MHLTNHQLFSLIFVFEIGSTTLFALGIDADQAAWIVILIALFISLMFIWIYTELQSAFPNKNYIEIIITVLGKWLGLPLCFLYIFDLIWQVGRNLREFGELIIITSLPENPLWLIISIFMLVSLYGLMKGFNIMARASEIVMPIIVSFSILIWILIYASGYMDFKNLLPVLGGGIKSILTSLPSILYFPFGEVYIFLMYWKYSNEKNLIRKTTIKSVFYSGILICISSMIIISVLGVKYTSISSIPLMEVIRLININNILSNIDSIGMILIFLGGFFKMSIFLNALVLVLATLLKIKNYKPLLILVCIFMVYFSIVFEPNFIYHQSIFPFDTKYFGILYSNFYPIIIFIIYKIKKHRMAF
ncbi:GerAB/ArcD/ProY family transporter [Clostridium sp. cel8]|uniref:GerAB/ArcD/ProY family transporter n=1 Tax=Clostridium sp. cel8 TaxID=2663123 RepID=UPI00325F995C